MRRTARYRYYVYDERDGAWWPIGYDCPAKAADRRLWGHKTKRVEVKPAPKRRKGGKGG